MKVLVLTLSFFFILRLDIADSRRQRPCPPRIDVDGVLYRNVAIENKTPCKGDISRCIYSLYWFEFCMNGNFPYYKPQKLPIGLYEDDEEESGGGVGYYVTTHIGTPSPFATPFNMSMPGPVIKYEFSSANFVNRLVCGGFEWVDSLGQKQPAIGTVAGTPVEVPVAPENYIIEVYGQVGYLLDRLYFVTMETQNPLKTHEFTCGGINGAMVDATPPGRCQMVNIAGTTKDVDGSQLLATMEFTWFCT